MDDLVTEALSGLVPGGVRRGELWRESRVLGWVEAGSGSPAVVLDSALGEPGSLAWAGVMRAVATRTRVIAYDRAGIGLSGPVSPLTLETQVGDLVALLRDVVNGSCVLVGHSWGGLLAQMLARSYPTMIAGLVLVDPADENSWTWLSPEEHQQMTETGDMVVAQHASGRLPDTIRDTFGPFAQRLTSDPQLQAVILDAYVSCYAQDWQARMVRDERLLFLESVPLIRQRRVAGALPDVPVVVFSATTGTSADVRDKWTRGHADLAASVIRGRHIVLADTDHAINQDRYTEIAETINRMIDDILMGS